MRVGAIALALVTLGLAIGCDGPDEPTAPTRSDRSTTTALDPVDVAAGPIQRVQPPAGSELATIDRDAGIAVTLRDNSVLWLFGDTAARLDDGTIDYFQIGTASWAPPEAPAVTDDIADPATGAPVTFATPTSDFPTCPGPGQRAGMWPASAIVQPVGERDRVIIWLHNICLGADGSLTDEGMALAEWWYDPAAPPVERPVVATILVQRLFADRSFGTAAVLGDDGDVYAYRCATPDDPADAAGYGPCAVARVPLADVADASAYTVVEDNLALPSGPTQPIPAGGFGVAHDPVIGAFVMAYSPWPGSTQVVDVRTSPSPLGPWSRPVTVGLDGCADRIGSRQFNCYAGGPQPRFSTPGHLGLGYYDSSVSTFPTRGAYTVTSVPWPNS